VVVASLDPSLSFEDIETRAKDLDWLNAASAGKKRLVKDHDLDGLVLPRLAGSSLGEVTPELKALAKSLGAYRRYRRLLDTYGAQVAPVRLVPDWKLSAPEQVKNMLNTYAEAEVREHFRKAEGADRLLGKADSVDSDKLTLMKGELATALLTWRSLEKVKSTYGEEFLKYVHPVTGRIHARYKQSLTGTGRLSSESPNAQNLPVSSARTGGWQGS
jgi:hypothetical protein